MIVKKLTIRPEDSIVEVEKDGKCLLKIEKGQITGPLIEDLTRFLITKVRLEDSKIKEYARKKITKILSEVGKDNLDASQIRKILISLLEYLSIV